MEPTHEPVPQDEPGERHEAEESMRYPEHGDPETLRERAGLRAPRRTRNSYVPR
jgi:hypothetical protein